MEFLALALLLALLTLPAAAQDLPWSDDFDDGDLTAWTAQDDSYFGAPVRSGPGAWRIDGGVLRQSSNIWIGDPPLEFAIHLGTHIAAGHSGWTDYMLNVDVRSTDDDGIGLLVRYQDAQNYYRLLLLNDAGNGGPVVKLERRTNGTFELLAEDRTGPAYPSGWFTLTADVRGDSLYAYRNGTLLFAVRDTGTPLAQGKVGLTVYANNAAFFDNVEVIGERSVRPAPAPPPPVARAPYLQLATSTSITIAWQTPAQSVSAVEYGPTPDLGLRYQTASAAHRHVATLGDLAPGTTYYYRVLSDDVEFQPVTPFRTAPPRSTPNVRMLVFGDSGTDTPAQHAVAELMEDKGEADFGIHVGDVSQYNGEEYDYIYFRPYRDLISRIPIFPSVGNHDTYADDAATYLDVFYLPANNPAQTERYYSFDYGPVHAIALDTNLDVTPGSVQYDWLMHDLQSAAAQEATWLFVYFHHPPYCQAWSDWAGDERVRRHLMPLFEQYGVDIVFNGHTHAYERGTLNGVTYVITGGGGGGLDDYGRDVLHIDVTALEHHFTFIDIQGSRLNLTAYRTDGSKIDHLTLEQSEPVPTEPAAHLPAVVQLETPFPNPLPRTDAATLAFRLPEQAPVAVTVYDTLGREVVRLVEATYEAGTHTLTWTPGEALAPGAYVLRLQYGTAHTTRAFTIVP